MISLIQVSDFWLTWTSSFLAHLSQRLKVSYCDHPPSIVDVVVRLSVRPSTIFEQHLLLNHCLEFDQTSQEWSLVGPLSNLFKWFRSIAYLGHRSLKIDFLTKKNLLVRNHWTDFNIILQKCFFGDLLPRLFKPFGFENKQKNMAARGRGLFSLYIYIENFKNLLVRNHWADFNITQQECFFCNPLPRLYKPLGFIRKHGRQGAGLIFPIYLYRKI